MQYMTSKNKKKSFPLSIANTYTLSPNMCLDNITTYLCFWVLLSSISAFSFYFYFLRNHSEEMNDLRMPAIDFPSHLLSLLTLNFFPSFCPVSEPVWSSRLIWDRKMVSYDKIYRRKEIRPNEASGCPPCLFTPWRSTALATISKLSSKLCLLV